MNLIVALGSNLGDRQSHLAQAKNELIQHLELVEASSILENEAVDYVDQPDFCNQILEFKIPTSLTPTDCLKLFKSIEEKMGRQKRFDKGPREIDIDIIFWGDAVLDLPTLKIPHPQWKMRPFVYELIFELKSYQRGVYDGFFAEFRPKRL
jgi:2-amino-4-hydroxy-6-hydroxymethyldihydropteridine diphosphokinase